MGTEDDIKGHPTISIKQVGKRVRETGRERREMRERERGVEQVGSLEEHATGCLYAYFVCNLVSSVANLLQKSTRTKTRTRERHNYRPTQPLVLLRRSPSQAHQAPGTRLHAHFRTATNTTRARLVHPANH